MDPAHANSPPVMIVGHGRSGTTLLTTMLNRHTQFASTPETYFWRDLHRYPGGWEAIIKDWPTSGRGFLESMDRWKEFGIDSQAVIDVHPARPAGPGELFCAMCQAIAGAAGKPRAVEKTPSHVRFLDPIRRELPDARIIHLVRDGRDVALSRRKLAWNLQSIAGNLYEWMRTVRLGRERLADDPHVMAVRYEDLVERPRETCVELCRFLGVDFEQHMLEPDESDSRVVEEGAYWKQGVHQRVHTDRVAVWQRETDEKQQRLAWAIAGDELRTWNYAAPEAAAQDAEDVSGARPRVYLSTDIENDAQGLALDGLVGELLDAGATLTGRCNVLETSSPADGGTILLTDSPRTLGWISRSRLALVLARRRAQANLKHLKNNDVRLVWLYHGSPKETANWPLRQRIETAIAQAADVIVAPPDADAPSWPNCADKIIRAGADGWKNVADRVLRPVDSTRP